MVIERFHHYKLHSIEFANILNDFIIYQPYQIENIPSDQTQ